jgi:hypothetical protein
MDCFVANYVYYHILVHFSDSDWLRTGALDNPHTRMLLTIDWGSGKCGYSLQCVQPYIYPNKRRLRIFSSNDQLLEGSIGYNHQ